MRRAFVLGLSILGVLAGTAFGCSDSDAPPYDELSLRDALRADPRSMETVPAPMKKVLADRFEREAETASGTMKVDAVASRLSAQEIVTVFDERRGATQGDAWVLSVVESDAVSVIAHPPSLRSKARDGERDGELAALPPIEGEGAAESTRDAEGRALRGRAGAILRAMLAETGAARIVRVSGWPIGAVVVDDTLYVNATWLVSMATLESSTARPEGTGGSVQGPVVAVTAPTTLRGNPYALFTTLASCVADVGSRCEACRASGACDSTATLDFPDGRSECLFLLEDKRRVEQLCVLALTSPATVAECVKADGCIPGAGATTQSSLAAAEPFLQKDACVRSLNLCLSGVNESKDTPSNDALVDVDVDGCNDPFKSCSSFFGGCEKACDKGKCSGQGGPSCQSCDGCDGCTRCSGCDTDSRRGEGTGYGSEGTGQDPNTNTSTSSGSTGSSGSTSGSSGSTSGSSGSTSGGTSSSSSGASGTSGGSSSGSSSASSSSGSTGSSGSSSSGSSGSSGSGSSSGCGGKSSSSSSSSGGSSSGSCKGCKSCGGSGSGGNCKCETAPPAIAVRPRPMASRPLRDAEEPGPLGPMTSMTWLVLPLFFLGKRARERGRGWRASDPNEDRTTGTGGAR